MIQSLARTEYLKWIEMFFIFNLYWMLYHGSGKYESLRKFSRKTISTFWQGSFSEVSTISNAISTFGKHSLAYIFVLTFKMKILKSFTFRQLLIIFGDWYRTSDKCSMKNTCPQTNLPYTKFSFLRSLRVKFILLPQIGSFIDCLFCVRLFRIIFMFDDDEICG